MAPEKFDVIVIGTGSAGHSIATQCREAGLTVATADDEFGGTCANKGCSPKKVLATSAEIAHYSKNLKRTGLAEFHSTLDWVPLVNFKRTFTDLVPYSTKKELKEQDIGVFEGKARFTSPHEIEVGHHRLRADKFVIATGARPVDLSIEGKEFVYTSADFMEYDSLPAEIIFTGGGYVAFELAHIAAMAGSKVTILEQGSLPLSSFDPELVIQLMKSLQDAGIDVKTGTEVQKVQRKENKYVVTTAKEANITINLIADMVINTAGRIPSVAGLQLENAGVDYDNEGIKVNEYLQSVSNPHIYAAGDVADTSAPFTPIANRDGDVVVHNIIHGNERKCDHTNMPTVLFTSPKLAGVGLSVREAEKKNKDVEIKEGSSAEWLISKSLGEKASAYKILIDKATNLILGAHLLHPKADEMINFLALAIHKNIEAEEIKQMLFAFPTATKEIQTML